MDGRGAEIGQFALLTRHFFGRLFHNDTIDFEDQVKEKLIVALSLLAVFFAWASVLMLFKYHFVADDNRSWQEKAYVLSLMMTVFAIATLLEWDVLFPDRRDYLNLMPLPVRLRTFFAAKLASFLLFIGLFSAAMMSVSSTVFSVHLAQWRGDTLGMALRYVGAHLVAGFAACFAVFFAIVFLQFLLMAALPEPVYRRSATAVRFALTVGLLFLLLGLTVAPRVLGRSLQDLAVLKATGDPFIARFPVMWFVGLYEVLLGTGDAVFAAGARTAGLVSALALLAFGGAAALSYRRHVLRTLEVRKAGPALPGLRRAWRRLLGRALLRRREEQAVYDFFGATLRSSPPHRMAFVYYLAAGSAGVLLLVFANRDAFRSPTPANGLLLVLPLLLAFTIVAGLRAVVDRPASLEAHWIFRITESPRPWAYVSGLKKAVAIRFLAPLFVLVFLIHLPLWGPRLALVHAAFGLTLSLLAVQAAFFRYRKVPFASPWVPGRLRLQFTAIPCLIGLLLGMMLLAAIEKAVLAEPLRALAFGAVAAGLGGLLFRANRRFFRERGLTYDDQPEAAMIEFPHGA